MLSCWSIRNKIRLAIAILSVVVLILSFSSFRGVYSFRGLAKGISARAGELPVATEIARHVSNLRAIVHVLEPVDLASDTPAYHAMVQVGKGVTEQRLQVGLEALKNSIENYREALRFSATNKSAGLTITDNQDEWELVFKIEQVVHVIESIVQDEDGIHDPSNLVQVSTELERLHHLAAALPGFLHDRMQSFAEETRVKYRTWIVLTWATSTSAVPLLLLLLWWLYWWIFDPLRKILHGSRQVADGQFDHRIHLRSRDEMGELARAMNKMTARFQEIRDDLDGQVKQRTQEVVRSEQLASVGFLAAGVAHEINNPLASIALCAESLEDRLHDIIQQDDARADEEHNNEISVVRSYLRMVQDEAFRCKQITEKLLDFSRLGDMEKQEADLTSLVEAVIEMVSHVGKYREKQIAYRVGKPVLACINEQEIKQVVLNLLTNALDSLNCGGRVEVTVRQRGNEAVLIFCDNGCGMTDEVRKHLFEPFFTRRRDGQGTGLGMSISYRIVNDHGGKIDVSSAGVGMGSTITVRLPTANSIPHKEHDHRQKNEAA